MCCVLPVCCTARHSCVAHHTEHLPPPLPSPPPRSKGDGDYEIIDNFVIDDWLRTKIAASEDELAKEKECVGHLIGVEGAACSLVGKEADTWLPGEK
jgi:hypothetical protein